MDVLRDDRGQTLLVVALAVAIAAIAVVGLRDAQTHLLATTASHRAGEAAVEAAAASLADAYVESLQAARARASLSPRPTMNVAAIIARPQVIDAARAAANDLARANGAGRIEDLATSCTAGRVEVRLTLDRFPHHAGFSAPECSRH